MRKMVKDRLPDESGPAQHCEVSRALLMARAKVDMQDEDGDTALMIVAADTILVFCRIARRRGIGSRAK